MLTDFSIANFKAFGPKPPQRVALRPLTLVFGANSAGKSSLIHSLLLARTAHDTGVLDVRPGSSIAGDSVDLGGFSQYVHRRHESNKPVTMSFTFDAKRSTGGADEVEATPLRSQLLAKSSTFGVTLLVDSAKSPEPRIESLSLDIDGAQLLRMVAVAEPGQKRMRLNLWETEHPVSQLFFEACLAMTPRDLPTDEDRKAYREAVYAILEEITLSAEKSLFPHEFVGRPATTFDLALGQRTGTAARLQVDEADSPGSAIRKNVELYFERSLGPLLRDIHDLFTASLGRLVYLGPLRKLPKRHLDAEELHDLDVASGASAWLKVMNDADVRAKVNAWLGNVEKLRTAYELQVQAVFTEGDLRRRGERSIKNAQESIVLQIVEDSTVQEAVDAIRDLRPDDYASYVEANPDLHRFVTECWHDAQVNYLKENEGHEEAEAYTEEQAASDVLDALDLYEQKILEHCRESSDDLVALVDRHGSSEHHLNSLISSVTKGSERRELSIVEKRHGTALSHRDIGVGISQILPVLVHAYAERNSLIAIEQPEIHVHPALQSEIADVFIESALGERRNTFLLETHSEHLILRIMKRIRETTRKQLPADATPIRPEDVQVIFVDSDATTKQTYARELRIDPQGRFVDNWPNGFFEERLRELF